ncbi:MAG: CCA tRNA nucleotidyltransferase [Rickettsiales bacterium]
MQKNISNSKINTKTELERSLSTFITKLPFYNKLKDFCNYINNSGKIRLVGGCVRDFILNKIPNDIDLSSDLEPNIIMELAKKYGAKTIPTGIEHGTVTVILDNLSIEITTLRYDVKCDGRHAIIQFTNDFYEDAKRRDFTINAMSFCLLENKLFDYFDGITHLKESKVIFIGDAKQRICEDYLRILRFFRFTSYYAKEIDLTGYESCLELAYNLNKISQERITSELNKTFDNTKNLNYILQYLQNIFPYINLPKYENKYKLLKKIDIFSSNYKKKIDEICLNLNLNIKNLNNINTYNIVYLFYLKIWIFCKK